jgi:ribA/ribD-fused uncharacterized protein
LTTATRRPDFPSWASNFYHSPLNWDGLPYADVESAFQSAKTLDRQARRRFAYPHPPGPGRAKQMGRALTLRADWEQVKDDVMLDILREKFRDRILAEKLLAHDEMLVEWTSWHDNWWGVCLCGREACHGGRNRLGTLLMQLRMELRGQVKPIRGSQVPLVALAPDGEPIPPHADMEAGRGDEAWVRMFAGETS